jgi:ABC-type sugar transport system ATPase subunit
MTTNVPPLLSVAELSKTFGQLEVLKNISFTVKRGETV